MATSIEDGPVELPVALEGPREEDLYKCIHCGFCLQACPTYLQTGLETESPRGRIALMKAVNEGRLEITPNVYRHWDLCIQCRACEVACPSGVEYGRLIEATMEQVDKVRVIGRPARLAASLLLKRILPDQPRLSLLIGAARMYQRSGVQSVIRGSGLLERISPRLAELERSLPPISGSFFTATGQRYTAFGERRARVALLSGCVMPLAHGPEMRAVARVLTRNGCEVVVPDGQVCCGAINTHVGDLETTRRLAKQNIDVFLASGVDAVVVASAGCGTRMKEYDYLLRDDAEYADRARMLVAMVKDVHEFLVDLPFIPPLGRLDYAVTYQDSCHLSHSQRITEQPRALLRSIPGLRLTEMDESTVCCGGGGTYTITQREFSLGLLDRKMGSIAETGVDVVATANPGCVIQLQYGMARSGSGLPVRYVTDLLDEAYRLAPREEPRPPSTAAPSKVEAEREELRARWRARSGDRRR